MKPMKAKSKGSVEISAIVTRADGTIEDHGVIATSENGAVRLYRRILKSIRGKK